MKNTIEILTLMFEYLEDDLIFEYQLFNKTIRGNKFKIISYYKNNLAITISIHFKLNYFSLNLITEKENSFNTTSKLNKLVYQGKCELKEYVLAKKKLNKLLFNK